ncbi:hypothetical protein [Paenibacillus popilliae]|uniref:hypothetical protein n=1 Tax=Paenibacillus popilliae TaxID=78057 RepID=UPI00030B1347|nr:hypothetical protein [Paenibacillus popilliae]
MKNMYATFKLYLLFYPRKSQLVIAALGIVNVLCQIFLLDQISIIEQVEVTVADSMLCIFGGLEQTYRSATFTNWLLTLLPIVLLIQTNACPEGIHTLLINRIGSRVKWWLAKSISMIFVIVFYQLFLFLITALISSFIFQTEAKWTGYTMLYYSGVYEAGIPAQTMMIILLLFFVTGGMTLALLISTLHFVVNYDSKKISIIILTFIVLAVLAINGVVPRYLSPFLYTSTLDILPTYFTYWMNLSVNIGVLVICLFIGCLLSTRKQL